jgi:hypothetical protein
MGQVKIETCSRYKARWFAIDLKDQVCHACFLRDKGRKTPFLMSTENRIDPGELPAYLPTLTQVEEIIIARSHVQIMVYRYRGHQYHYSGHCVSFMQNTIKTVDMLPNLPSELDVVVLWPSDRVVQTDLRYQRQFRTDFWVRKGCVITWLQFLKAHNPDYQHVTISPNRINALPIDSDISVLFTAIITNDTGVREEPPVPEPPVTGELPPPNA